MSDLEMLKDIPGYKAILKSVLKSQIQLLIQQLAENTGEESIILTASVNDGTLSHLGSSTGKGFLEGRDEIKSQFLGYCLKSHHKKKSLDTRPTPYQRPNNQGASPGNSIGPGNSLGPGPRPMMKQGLKRPRLHPVSLQRAGDESPLLGAGGSPTMHPGNSAISGMSPVSSDVKQEGGDGPPADSMSPAFTSTPSSFPSSLHLSHTQTSASSNFGDPGTSATDSGGGIGQSAEESNDSSATNIKIEPITENEMELEITGVEPGNESWDQSQAGYSGMASGDDSLSQGGDPAAYNFFNMHMATNGKGFPGNPFLLPNHQEYARALLLAAESQLEPGWHLKNYECEHCGKIFASKTKMLVHTRIHTGEKPFQCQFCSRGFSQKSSLKTHIRTHTGEKPFSCKECKVAYTNKASYNYHMQKVHTPAAESGDKPTVGDGRQPTTCDGSTNTESRQPATSSEPSIADIRQAANSHVPSSGDIHQPPSSDGSSAADSRLPTTSEGQVIGDSNQPATSAGTTSAVGHQPATSESSTNDDSQLYPADEVIKMIDDRSPFSVNYRNPFL